MEKVMAKYEVRDVVCDHGLYEDGELKLILNSAKNAHMIKRILEIDGSVPNVATTADVVEVRHGYWDDNIIGFCNVCMECGAIVERTAIKNRSGELNHCPNCGAKMDGERKG